MADISETVEVAADPHTAYAVWADFAGYPEFVKGVESVTRSGDRLHWVAKVGPRKHEWEANIIAEEPGRRLAWVAPEGPIDTDIRFEPTPSGGARVTFQERMHDSLAAEVAVAVGFGASRARDDLERYRELVEARA